ncbi:tetratricopeptide repeat protein, partial [Kaarinaea lacus]
MILCFIVLSLPFNEANAEEDFASSMDVTMYRLATEHNDSSAQYLLGRKYYTGTSVTKSIGEAIKWFELAATQNHKKAQFQLGKMYLYGDGVARNYKYAFDYLKKAAANHYPEAQYELGNYYLMDATEGKDYPKAVKWYRAAAERQHIGAMVALGKILHKGARGVKADTTEARYYLKIAAESGDVDAGKYMRLMAKENLSPNSSELKQIQQMEKVIDDAHHGHIPSQYVVGIAYLNGDGLNKDTRLAAKWLRRAANNDHGQAQYMLSKLYRDGVGVERNADLSSEWLRIAASSGILEAQHDLEARHLSGSSDDNQFSSESSEPVVIADAKNKELIIVDDEDVFAQGTPLESVAGANVAATDTLSLNLNPTEPGKQFDLAARYISGEGVTADLTTAALWYEKAAEQNHVEAQFKIGEMYKNGIGVETDKQKAQLWLHKASDGGYTEADRLLHQLQLEQKSHAAIAAKKSTTPSPPKSALTKTAISKPAAVAKLQESTNNHTGDSKTKERMITDLGKSARKAEDSSQEPATGIAWLQQAADQ